MGNRRVRLFCFVASVAIRFVNNNGLGAIWLFFQRVCSWMVDKSFKGRHVCVCVRACVRACFLQLQGQFTWNTGGGIVRSLRNGLPASRWNAALGTRTFKWWVHMLIVIADSWSWYLIMCLALLHVGNLKCNLITVWWLIVNNVCW